MPPFWRVLRVCSGGSDLARGQPKPKAAVGQIRNSLQSDK